MRKLTVAKRRFIVGLVALTLLSCTWSIARLNAIDGPVFLGKCYGPDYVFAEFVREHSGLPRENLDLLDAPESVNVYPVAHWTVVDVEVESSYRWVDYIFNDSAAYRVSAEVRVQYTDGHESTLMWRSWRYGQVYAPLVCCRGDGPPGYIEVLDLRTD